MHRQNHSKGKSTHKMSVKHSLLLADVAGTVVGALAGKRGRVRLYAVRVEYLEHPAKVDVLHEKVDVRAPDVVAEDEQGLLDAARLGQRDDEVAQVGQPVVHLDDDDGRVGGQGPEGLLVQDPLLGVDALDLPADLGDLRRAQELLQLVRAAARAVGACARPAAERAVPTVLQEPGVPETGRSGD